MGIGYTNTIETQTISNEIPFAPIPDVRFARSVENGSISAFFQDPKDIYVDGQLITKREETIIVARKGAPPENHLDGEYLYTHTGYHDVQKWLEFIPSYSDYNGAGAQLYVQFFAVSTSGNVYPITRVYKLYPYLYVVRIEEDNPNPDTRVRPSGSAITALHPATPAEWELVEPFKSIRPCLFKNGKVQYYLDKEDFTKREDGSPSDIESGADGDVMIEFPNVNVIVLEGGVVISGIPFPPHEDSALSPLKGFDSLDNFYVSAYLGCKKEGELRSLAGYDVAIGSLPEAESLLNQKGQRYDLLPFWVLNAIQALFILKYKTTNSEVIGYGRVKISAMETPRTGTTRNAPMDSGTTENTNQNVKLFGIEGLWGMEMARVSGIKPESHTSLRVDTSRDGSSFKIVQYAGAGQVGFMKNALGGLLGFIAAPPLWEGSESTYFCDHFNNWGMAANFSNEAFFGPRGIVSDSVKRYNGLFSSGFHFREAPAAIRFVYY